jgi:hypothetical protein
MVNELHQMTYFGRVWVQFLGGTVSWTDFTYLVAELWTIRVPFLETRGSLGRV